MAKAMVRNAADGAQVGAARENERFRKEREQRDMATVLAIPEGRRMLWRFLGQTRVFDSIFVTSSEIYYRAGQQDVGHALLRDICEADPRAYILMQQEAAKLEADVVEPEPTEEDL